MPVSFVGPPIDYRSIYNDTLVITQMPIHRVTIASEMQDYIPDNFDQLPVEEQERIKARLRFMGIRLRGDVEEPIKLNKQTLDLP